MQREFSWTKYKPQATSTIVAYRGNEWEQSQIIFGRKFSSTIEKSLSNTVINNDSNIVNTILLTPSKEHISIRGGNERVHINNQYSPFRESEAVSINRDVGDNKNRESYNQPNVYKDPKTNNLFSTKYAYFKQIFINFLILDLE